MSLNLSQAKVSGNKCIRPKLIMELSWVYHLRILNDLLKENMVKLMSVHPRKVANGVS